MTRETLDPLPLVSLEAEQELLGAILLAGNLSVVPSWLRAEHFAEEVHRRIFEIATALGKDERPTTPATIAPYLQVEGLDPRAYIARLVTHAVRAPALVPGTARELRSLAGRRQCLAIAEDLAAKAKNAGPDVALSEIIGESIDALQAQVEATTAADTRRDPGECGQIVVDKVRAIMNGERAEVGVSTGLPDLDRATGGGFRAGTLWIIAGRPRMGKTIAATGFAKKVAVRSARDMADGLPGVGVALFSLEVAQDELTARLLADLGYNPRQAVTYGAILAGDLDEDSFATIDRARGTLATLPLSIDVADGLTLAEITARVRAEKARMAKRGIRLAIVFLDYLKQIKATDRYKGNRVYEIGEISGGLKALAKREGVCICLLAQLNRGVEQKDRKDKTPGLADLRESGDLEADADVVLIIDRESVRIRHSPEYKNGDEEAVERFRRLEHHAEFIVAKTRVGSERTVDAWFHAGCSTFGAPSREASL